MKLISVLAGSVSTVKELSLGKKMAVGFGAILSALLGLTILAFIRVHAMGDALEEVGNLARQRTEAIQGMQKAAEQFGSSLLSLPSMSPDQLAPEVAKLGVLQANFAQSAERARKFIKLAEPLAMVDRAEMDAKSAVEVLAVGKAAAGDRGEDAVAYMTRLAVGEDLARWSPRLDKWKGSVGDLAQWSDAYSADEALESSKLAGSAKLALVIGALLTMGMSAGLGWKLTSSVNDNVRMLEVIEEQNVNLEVRVADRTAQLAQKTSDINAMLQNMALGVCTITQGLKVHPEYSRHLHALSTESVLADRGLMDGVLKNAVIDPDQRDQMLVGLESIIGESSMMWDFNSHLLPTELKFLLQNDSLVIQLAWSPITDEDDNVQKVLLIMQDVTQLRGLEREAAAQRAELDMLAQVLKLREPEFNGFIESARELIGNSRALVEETSHWGFAVVNGLFRDMHTIKGNARTLNLSQVTNAAHLAEQLLNEIRSAPDSNWSGFVAKLLDDQNKVLAQIDRYDAISRVTLGRGGASRNGHDARQGVFIGNEQLQALRLLASEGAAGKVSGPWTEMKSVIDSIGAVPLQELLSNIADAAPAVADSLGKPAPLVQMQGPSVSVSPPIARALKNALVHVLRNSLDHGIESADDRLASGKAAAGHLQLRWAPAGDFLELRVSDDGRGLALARIRAKAQGNGLLPAGQEAPAHEVAELIFHPGLTTAKVLTATSGRGVGMDAVRTFLAQQGGHVSAQLVGEENSKGYAPFHLLLRWPLAACHFPAAPPQSLAA